MTKQSDAMKWFKQTFGAQIETAVAGTPFTLNMLTAIAFQETYYIWGKHYQTKTLADLLKICVGDTLDAPNRSAFPKTRAELEAHPQGNEMFAVAREALVTMAKDVDAFKNVAQKADKFCHGFGIFQYDIQHFKTNPDYFLTKGWHDFDKCAALCVSELKAALKRAYPGGKNSLTHDEMVYVAIAYNRGSVDFTRKFKQGFRDDTGKFYGEYMDEYLTAAEGIVV